MLTNKRERARQQRAALWATRDNVQRHALSMSMPWLAFVNIAFALMIFFRNFIPRFYVSTSKSIIKALINMHSFEIQLSPIG
ncbi:membrane-associated sensor domain-containing protein [Klebsiella pneumoniae]